MPEYITVPFSIPQTGTYKFRTLVTANLRLTTSEVRKENIELISPSCYLLHAEQTN